jgi:hypothetical protein
MLLTRTHKNVKVVNGRPMLKCGSLVIEEVTLQTLTSCALQWHKFNWEVVNTL